MLNRVEVLADKLFGFISDVNIDSAIITNSINRKYLTGFNSSSGFLIITKDTSYLLVDFRYFEAAKKEVTNCNVVMLDNLSNNLKEIINKHNIRSVLLEYERLTLAKAEHLQSILSFYNVNAVKNSTLDSAINNMRMIKSNEEIKKIRASQEITEAAFNYIIPYIKEGITERELALNIEFFMRKQGAESVAFELIVVSGKNSSLPHGVPSDKQLQKGDFITMDTGAVLDGYHSDMTRTVALGNVSAEQEKIYNIVLKAQIEGIKSIMPGKTCGEVDKVVRDFISNEGYGEYFGHGTGHSVGLEIHEDPRFCIGSNVVLEPNMVLTVEPGIYLPNKFGVRIEDMVAINQTGCHNLTSLAKNLIIL